MFDAAPRRTFLRQLASLPLIGGSVTLIGQPTAVAEPVSREDMVSYANWLFYERRIACYELAGFDGALARQYQSFVGGAAQGPEFHFPNDRGWRDVPMPSTRATLVMATVGFDWRQGTKRVRRAAA